MTRLHVDKINIKSICTVLMVFLLTRPFPAPHPFAGWNRSGFHCLTAQGCYIPMAPRYWKPCKRPQLHSQGVTDCVTGSSWPTLLEKHLFNLLSHTSHATFFFFTDNFSPSIMRRGTAKAILKLLFNFSSVGSSRPRLLRYRIQQTFAQGVVPNVQRVAE